MKKAVVWVLAVVFSVGCLGIPACAQTSQYPVATPYQTAPPPPAGYNDDAAYYASSLPPGASYCRGPSGESVIADAVIVRPVGIAAMVVGVAGAIVALPFAATSNSMDTIKQALILKPFDYTFRRPLGDFDYGQCDP